MLFTIIFLLMLHTCKFDIHVFDTQSPVGTKMKVVVRHNLLYLINRRSTLT